MGERVDFQSNGHKCQGYLAIPATGSGPAVVVIQEWWGLVPHIEQICDRFAREGFVAIAPDLYHGRTTSSPDDAGKMLMELDADRAEKEISAAGAWLLARPECTSKTFGVVGFCMGGALAQLTASRNADVGAAASFYGGFKKVEVDWSRLKAPLLLIYGENDRGVPAEGGRQLEKELKTMAKSVELVVYPGADHAFFNDSRLQVYNRDAAEDAWNRTIALFRRSVR